MRRAMLSRAPQGNANQNLALEVAESEVSSMSKLLGAVLLIITVGVLLVVIPRDDRHQTATITN